jgi:hypothetical protein
LWKTPRKYLLAGVLTLVAWSLIRSLAVWTVSEGTSVDVRVFIAIDIISVAPYAIGLSKIVEGAVNKSLSLLATGIVVALLSFMAPYFYLFWSGQSGLSREVYFGIAIVMIVMFIAGPVRVVYSKIFSGKDDR